MKYQDPLVEWMLMDLTRTLLLILALPRTSQPRLCSQDFTTITAELNRGATYVGDRWDVAFDYPLRQHWKLGGR